MVGGSASKREWPFTPLENDSSERWNSEGIGAQTCLSGTNIMRDEHLKSWLNRRHRCVCQMGFCSCTFQLRSRNLLDLLPRVVHNSLWKAGLLVAESVDHLESDENLSEIKS